MSNTKCQNWISFVDDTFVYIDFANKFQNSKQNFQKCLDLAKKMIICRKHFLQKRELTKIIIIKREKIKIFKLIVHIFRLEADVRPGLVKSHKIARRMKMEEKKEQTEAEQRHKQKPVRQLEEERREEGLKSAIPSDNKGFSMMAKMGYKQGDTIGRSSSSGIVEPISIQIKSDRGGLGREAAIKQLQEYKNRLRQTKAEQKNETSTSSISQFRQRMAQKTSDKQLEADLRYGLNFMETVLLFSINSYFLRKNLLIFNF